MSLKHCIFQIYMILTKMAEPIAPPFLGKCEAKLDAHWSEQKNLKILKLADVTAIDTNTIQINYKCISRWYATQTIAHKYQPEKNHHSAGEDVG